MPQENGVSNGDWSSSSQDERVKMQSGNRLPPRTSQNKVALRVDQQMAPENGEPDEDQTDCSADSQEEAERKKEVVLLREALEIAREQLVVTQQQIKLLEEHFSELQQAHSSSPASPLIRAASPIGLRAHRSPRLQSSRPLMRKGSSASNPGSEFRGISGVSCVMKPMLLRSDSASSSRVLLHSPPMTPPVPMPLQGPMKHAAAAAASATAALQALADSQDVLKPKLMRDNSGPVSGYNSRACLHASTPATKHLIQRHVSPPPGMHLAQNMRRTGSPMARVFLPPPGNPAFSPVVRTSSPLPRAISPRLGWRTLPHGVFAPMPRTTWEQHPLQPPAVLHLTAWDL